MKVLSVIQHTSAEYLGLMEDHLEGRQIRFKYYRPFVEGNPMPDRDAFGDGLVLLGGGPWGAAGVRDIPTLADEITVTRSCLMQGKPIIAIGLGATILAMAAGGSAKTAPFTFSVGEARRVKDDALNGYLPDTFPHVLYMRDAPVLPDYAEVLAVDKAGEPAVFQIGENAFGFTGHPATKPAIIEDLLMEFEEIPENSSAEFDSLNKSKTDLEDALVPIMTGIIQMTGLMSKS
jgi:GMP synthase-like glutamine amidotransferase